MNENFLLWLWLWLSRDVDALDYSALARLLAPGFFVSTRLLYLDFDEPTSSEAVEIRVHNVAEMVGIRLELLAIHRTRRGIHVIVNAEWPDLKDVLPSEIVALQLLLGSDQNREALNLFRAHHLGDAPEFWRSRWNVLYTEKL